MDIQLQILIGHLRRVQRKYKSCDYDFPDWIFEKRPVEIRTQLENWQGEFYTHLNAVRAARHCSIDMMPLSKVLYPPSKPTEKDKFLASSALFFRTLQQLVESYLQTAAKTVSEVDRYTAILAVHYYVEGSKTYESAFKQWTKFNPNSHNSIFSTALQRLLIQGFSSSIFVNALKDLCAYQPDLFDKVFGVSNEEDMIRRVAGILGTHLNLPELLLYDGLETAVKVCEEGSSTELVDDLVEDASDILAVNKVAAKKFVRFVSSKLENYSAEGKEDESTTDPEAATDTDNGEGEKIGGDGLLTQLVGGALGVPAKTFTGSRDDPYRGIKEWLKDQSSGEQNESKSLDEGEPLLGAPDEDYDEEKELQEELRKLNITEEFSEYLDPKAIMQWLTHQQKTKFAGVVSRFVSHLRGTSANSKFIAKIIPDTCKSIVSDSAFHRQIAGGIQNVNLDKLTEDACTLNPNIGHIVKLVRKVMDKMAVRKVVRVRA